MKLYIAAIGRLKSGPEAELVSEYAERIRTVGRGLGVSHFEILEKELRSGASGAQKDSEAKALLSALPPQTVLFALDEHGEDWSSRRWADKLAAHRDQGAPSIAIAIGGADGHGDALLNAAKSRIAFGRATWPHRLVRAMAAEQLYRALSILSGAPYHRD